MSKHAISSRHRAPSLVRLQPYFATGAVVLAPSQSQHMRLRRRDPQAASRRPWSAA